MRILYVEDSSPFRNTVESRLVDNGHIVESAATISRANGCLSLHEFDCLIVDLNMQTLGLSPEQIEYSDSGLCTGWIWLREQVFKDGYNKSYESCVIICSAYLKDVKPDIITEIENIGILCINKSDGIDALIKEIKKIEYKTKINK
jgi:hypothetical protein